MPFDIDISPSLAFMLEHLPRHTRGLMYLRLARIAEAAEHWPVEDLRWQQLARSEGGELLLYVDHCCLRLELASERRQVVIREVGRVLVHLPRGQTTQEVTSSAPAAITC